VLGFNGPLRSRRRPSGKTFTHGYMAERSWRNGKQRTAHSDSNFRFLVGTCEFYAQTNDYIAKENKGTGYYANRSSVKNKVTRCAC
jgi:hypothetical protein